MVRSRDPESTTMISSAHFTLSSVRGRFASSFMAIIAIDKVVRDIPRRINHLEDGSLAPASRTLRCRSSEPDIHALLAHVRQHRQQVRNPKQLPDPRSNVYQHHAAPA